MKTEVRDQRSEVGARECGDSSPLSAGNSSPPNPPTPGDKSFGTENAVSLAQSKTWRFVAAVVRRRLTSHWRNAQRSISRALTSAATLALFCLLPSAFCLRAQAQFSLDWFTVDGGGGTSTGGVFSVSGTIGQPDAGRMSGGNFTVDGGFWGIIAAIQTPGAPLLTVTLNPQLSTVTVSWPRPAEGWVLDWTPLMASPPAAIPWTLVPVAQYQTNSTHIFFPVAPTPGSKAFFRLRKQ